LGWPIPTAVTLSVLFCTILGVGCGLVIFERFARRLSSEARNPTPSTLSSVVLDSAIVSFALYLLLVNGIQWGFSGMTDAISLRSAHVDPVRLHALPWLPIGLHTNRIGMVEIITCWTLSCLLIAMLSSRFGLKLRAVKANMALFEQVSGQGRLVRLLAFGFCSAAAAFAGNVLLMTSRLDVTGGLSVVLGAMVVMILGTQSRRLILVPVFSLAFACLQTILQAAGLSLWIEPITLIVLLLALILSPRGLVLEVTRAEEALEV
jgi:branched-subunit amino acid ABC-type transport system permease component